MQPASIPTQAEAATVAHIAPTTTAEGQPDAHRSASVEAQDTTKPQSSSELAKPKATAESTPELGTVEAVSKDSPVFGMTVAQASTSAPSENGKEQPSSFASFASNSAPFASAGANKPLFNFGSLANGAGEYICAKQTHEKIPTSVATDHCMSPCAIHIRNRSECDHLRRC